MKFAVDAAAYPILNPLAAKFMEECPGGLSQQERIVLHERVRSLLPSLQSVGDEDLAPHEIGEGLDEALKLASQLVRTPLKRRGRISRLEEQVLFKGYNAAKRVARSRICSIDDESGMDSLERAVSALRHVSLIRQAITESNISMVLGMLSWVLGRKAEYRTEIPFARVRLPAGRPWVDYGAMRSDGNLALLRAIEKFDYRRGFKFSTYSCKGIIKRFGRFLSKEKEHQRRFEQLDEYRASFVLLDEATPFNDAVKKDASELVRSAFLALDELEQFVLRRRFGLHDGQSRTLEEVGLEVGLSKERVRQIQREAIQKIRKLLL